MKFKELWHKSKIYIAIALTVIAMNQAIAGNVHGTVQSVPAKVPVKADVLLINKTTGDTTKTQSNSAGNFSINVTPGNYKLETIANHHYDFLDTNFIVNGDTTLDLRIIKGQHDNGTPILICPLPYYNSSILKFAKAQYGRLDNNPIRHDVMNWETPRRRLYVTGITGQSRLNLDTILAVNQTSPAGIYYDEQTSDSAGGVRIYGTRLPDPNLGGATGKTWMEAIRLSTNPIIDLITGARIYIDTTNTIDKRIFADELLHAENQGHYSLWSWHIENQTGVPDSATQTSPDEIYIAAINQTLKLGEDWRKHKDTIKTIIELPETFSISYMPGWNMVSVPTNEIDMSANAIFPEKIGSAFEYDNAYKQADTLKNGKGYWIKLANAIEKIFPGQKIEQDTIDLNDRWNIIGGIGYPVSVDSIEQIDGIQFLSNFYRYNEGYKTADTIQPGEAVWIKANQPGKIVLKKPGLGANTSKNLPQIAYDTDMPDTPTVSTSIRENSLAYPQVVTLSQNYPNPFNPATCIKYDLPRTTHVRLSVFDVLGREVTMLVDEIQQAGSKSIDFNAEYLPSGIYFYRLQAGNVSKANKLILLK